MNENEMILKELRKQTVLLRLKAVCGVITAAALIVIAVWFVRITPVITETADTVVQTVNEIRPQAERVITECGDIAGTLGKTADSIDDIASFINEKDIDSMASAFEVVSKIDIDGLNRSIKKLSDIIAPIASLFDR